MKMLWLHKFFGLFFIPVNGRAKSAQQLIFTVLPFHPLYFPCTKANGKVEKIKEDSLDLIPSSLPSMKIYFLFSKLC